MYPCVRTVRTLGGGLCLVRTPDRTFANVRRPCPGRFRKVPASRSRVASRFQVPLSAFGRQTRQAMMFCLRTPAAKLGWGAVHTWCHGPSHPSPAGLTERRAVHAPRAGRVWHVRTGVPNTHQPNRTQPNPPPARAQIDRVVPAVSPVWITG